MQRAVLSDLSELQTGRTESMIESSTILLGKKRFETQVGEYRIVTDQPVASGGDANGPAPPELVLASIGSCAAHYAGEYLRHRSLPLDGLHVRVFAEMCWFSVKWRVGVPR